MTSPEDTSSSRKFKSQINGLVRIGCGSDVEQRANCAASLDPGTEDTMQKPETQQRASRRKSQRVMIHNIGVDPLRVMQNMRLLEKDHTFYSKDHTYIKYRRIVANWLLEMGDYFRLQRSTTYAAICLLDRIKPDDRFKRFQWQLLAICCLLLSAKYYEREQDVPALSKLEEITQDKLPNATVLTYEMWILSRLDWDVGATCAQHFLDYYLAVGLFCEGDVTTDPKLLEQDPSAPRAFVAKLAERCMIEYHMKPFAGSSLAAAIMYLARERFGVVNVWPSAMANLTGYSTTELEPVIAAIRLMLEESSKPAEAPTAAHSTPVTKQSPVNRPSPRGVDELV